MKYLNKISTIVATLVLITGLSFSAALAQSTNTNANQAKKHSLSGKVVSAQSGQAVANAKVMIYKVNNNKTSRQPLKTTMTNKKGMFQIKKISEGTYLVKVKADNYKTWKKQATINKKDISMTIKLKPAQSK